MKVLIQNFKLIVWLLTLVLSISLVSSAGIEPDWSKALAYYTFDDAELTGTTMDDLSNASNDATKLFNATTGHVGVINESFNLSSSNGGVLATWTDTNLFYTIAFWIKIPSIATFQPRLWTTYSNTSTSELMGDTYNVVDCAAANDYVYQKLYHAVDTQTAAYDSGIAHGLCDNNWHHVGWTFDHLTDNVTFFLDGAFLFSDGMAAANQGYGNGNWLVLGASTDNAVPYLFNLDREVNGTMFDEVYITQEVMNHSQFEYLYNGGSPGADQVWQSGVAGGGGDPGQSDVTIVLNSPYFNQTDYTVEDTITFNCTAGSIANGGGLGADITSMTALIYNPNGTINTSSTTPVVGNDTVTWDFTNLTEGYYRWDCNATINSTDNNQTVEERMFRIHPIPDDIEPFTLVLFPDTQLYSELYPTIFDNISQWVVDNETENNIKIVMHEGDIVDDWNVAPQWANANDSLEILDDGNICWGAVSGNHDVGGSYPYDYTYYDINMPLDRFSGQSCYGGSYDSTARHTYRTFEENGINYLVLWIGYSEATLDAAVNAWINQTLQDHNGYKKIIIAHRLIDSGGAYEGEGQTVYDDFITWDPDVILTSNGHSIYGNVHNEKSESNHSWFELLKNYQHEAEGGSGYIPLLRFEEDELVIRTYSPYLDTWREEAEEWLNFTLDYDASIASDLDEGAVAWWKFEDASLIDELGGYTWTSYGGVPVTDATGDAYDFEESNDTYMEVGDESVWDFVDAMTVCMWYKPESTDDIDYLITRGEYASSDNDDKKFTLSYENHVRFRLNNRGDQEAYSNSTLVDGLWYHLCGVYNNTASDQTIKVYVNGTYDTNLTVSDNSTSVIGAGTRGMILGANIAAANSADGIIDEVRLWNRPLTNNEIESLFFNPTGIFEVTAIDWETNLTINNFNVTVDGLYTLSTDNGTIITNLSSNPAEVHDLVLQSQHYFDETLENYDCSDNLDAVMYHYTNVTLWNIDGPAQIKEFDITIDGLVYNASDYKAFVPYNTSKDYLLNATNFINTTGTHDFFGQNILNATVFQSLIIVQALDNITGGSVSRFNITSTNFSEDQSSGFFTENGTIWVYTNSSVEYYNITVFTETDSNYNDTIPTTAGQNTTVIMNITSSLLDVTLYRESTGMPFDVASTNRTYAHIICEDDTIYNQTISSWSFGMNTPCDWSQIIFYVDYSGGNSYFRSLIPPITGAAEDLTVFLIDLNDSNAPDTALQYIIRLNDLTGDYSEAELTMTTGINGTNYDVIETPFDASSEAEIYLVQNREYIMKIRGNDGDEINLGVIVADTAQTLTITVPEIDIYPTDPVVGSSGIPGDAIGANNSIGGGVYWDYEFNASAGILQLVYVDPTESTTSVFLDVLNRSSNDQTKEQLFDTLPFTCYNASTCTFLISNIDYVHANMSYYTQLIIFHEDLGYYEEERIFRSEGFGTVDIGIFGEDLPTLKKLGATMLLGLTYFAFSPATVGIALVAVFAETWFFYQIDWLNFQMTDISLFIGMLGLIAFLTWIIKNKT